MSDSRRYSNPLRRDGTSQRQRSPAALPPSSVAVDERQLSDHLLYARKVARLLRYYGPDDRPAGDWTGFLDQDPTTVAAAVAETDPETVRERFEPLLDATRSAADKAAAFAALLPPVVELARTFDGWYRGSPAGLSLRRALERLIASVLRDAFRGAVAAVLRAQELGMPVAAVDVGVWSDVWELDGVEADRSLFPSGLPLDDGEAAVAAGHVARIFERFYEALTFLAGEAPAHLAQTLEDYPRHPPHMALLLAFLQLLGHARDHLNTLTAAHLDFYYRRVLGLRPRRAEPDQVHLLFELAKRFESHRVEEDTALQAGKDASGVELLYATDEEVVVHRARLDPEHGLKTIFVDKADDGRVRGVHAAPDADSADGLGAEIEDEEGKWEGLGSSAMPYAELGFAIASPMFFLAEGERAITLTLRLTVDSDLLAGEVEAEVEAALKDHVQARASGEKGWLEVAVASVDYRAAAGGAPSLTYVLRLASGDGPVVAYDAEVLGGALETVYPVIKLTFDNPAEPYPYEYFRRIEVAALEISLDVDGVRGLLLENDFGVLNPAKPFHPFGPVPKKGGSFLVGSPEVFLKPVSRLDLDLEWADLPEQNFQTHYNGYTQGQNPIVDKNAYFEATFSVLRDGDWQESPSHKLFDGTGTPEPPPAKDRAISLQLATPLSRVAEVAGFDRYSASLRRGFLRATLEKSFLHGLYPKLLAAAAAGGAVPNQPYTPMMASLSLDYEAAVTVDYRTLGEADFGSRVERIFQLGPFGHREVFPIASKAPSSHLPIHRMLVPRLAVTRRHADGGTSIETAEGTLLIGLLDLEPPQNLALLFQVAEGSEDPLATAQEVVWSYLENDRWVDFETSEVLADSTRGLLTSGIVRLACPKRMTPAKTLLPAGRHWIKASVHRDSRAIPKLIGVHTQAVAASFRDQGNDPGHLASALPAGTIAKLKRRAAAVKAVAQPYSSFGGRMEEEGDAFYVRASERLRHRGRAVTIFDYERLVLERFPEVYKVRCLNHTRSGSELAPGHVALVLVPNLRNKNAVDPLKPRLSLAGLESIREYLEKIASDFVTLEVKNPDYEEIRVQFNVRLLPGRDKGFHTRKLDQDIVGFLSPWLVDDAADVALGGRIHRSEILEFVEKRDYVDFVTDFRMDHLTAAGDRLDVEQAEATTASAALVSAKSHAITHSAYSCIDREAEGS